MIGLVSLLELALALSVVFAVWRIHSHVRAIREHFDRVDAAVAPTKIYYSEGWWRSDGGKRYGPFKTQDEAVGDTPRPAPSVKEALQAVHSLQEGAP